MAKKLRYGLIGCGENNTAGGIQGHAYGHP